MLNSKKKLLNVEEKTYFAIRKVLFFNGKEGHVVRLEQSLYVKHVMNCCWYGQENANQSGGYDQLHEQFWLPSYISEKRKVFSSIIKRFLKLSKTKCVTDNILEAFKTVFMTKPHLSQGLEENRVRTLRTIKILGTETGTWNYEMEISRLFTVLRFFRTFLRTVILKDRSITQIYKI